MNNSVFFVTVMKGEGSSWPRPIGMFSEYKFAENTILDTKQKIQEDIIRHEKFYDYATIEEIEFGIFRQVKNRWVFEWNEMEECFELTHVEPEIGDCSSVVGLF